MNSTLSATPPDPVPLEIAATFTAEPVAVTLEHWFEVLGLVAELGFAPYNQVFQSLLDPAGRFAANTTGMNVLLVRPEDWQRFGANDEENRWKSEIERNAGEFIEALRSAASRHHGRHLVVLCPASPAVADDSARRSIITGVERQIASDCRDAGIEVITPEMLAQLYPVDDDCDPVADREGHVPYTDTWYAALGTLLARKLHRTVVPAPKVLVLDCDNTLWGGVCGELGPENIVVSESFQAIQRLAKSQREAGALLCLCSKNNEDDVRKVFARHPGMILQADDITSWKINWEPKSQNIAALAAELNLSLDSVAFIDDNPVEIAEVSAALPAVLPILLPEDFAQDPGFIEHLWTLDLPAGSTEEDRQRTELYRAIADRSSLRDKTPDFESFLKDLQLELDVRPAGPDDFPRLAQLTERTSQFNASTIQRTAAEIAHLVDSGQHGLAVRLSDRFGSYGLVGLIMFAVQGKALLVDNFLLSCRVLGKGVEQKVLAQLGSLARTHGAETISIFQCPTARNEPLRRFLEGIEEARQAACEGGVIVHVPTEAAIAIGDRPASEWTPAAADTPGRSSTRGARIDPAIYAAIARTGRDPEGILAATAMQRHTRPNLAGPFVAARTETERHIAELWQQVLRVEEAGIEDRFSELGGKSLQVIQLLGKLTRTFGVELGAVELFENPTIALQAALVEKARTPSAAGTASPQPTDPGPARHEDLAVIGMALKVPGARNVEEFWQNLLEGKESLTRLSDEELQSAGVDVNAVRSDPSYHPVKGLMPEIDCFDAAFFGILPKEAKLMDPQQRIFLELAWEGMERAGYDSARYDGKVGVWAGAYLDTYALANLATDREFLAKWIPSIQVGSLQAELGNDKDYLATRVAYKLDLRGPAMTVQTACSTSLVAISQACQSLRAGECDMALAGGVIITLPERKGYYYTPDGMLSGDGSCRAFDAEASGTVFSNGAGVVLIKRLADALRDGDHIHSVIKGSATNNDGGTKHSYTAPSIDGQADVITTAITNAGIAADTISYVETHGTGTPLGDPIEVAGLTKAFRALGVTGNGQCALGSVKTNIGHLDVASGVTALIKTSLALEHGVIPPTIHYKNPNPKIDFEASPFFVNDTLRDWTGSPVRRAGVSSFGVGGTNAHVILEEPPARPSQPSRRGNQLFLLSARTEEALDEAHRNFVAHCAAHEDLNPADVAWTLRAGRRTFPHRRVLVGDSLATLGEAATAKAVTKAQDPPIVFMFPGQGSQTINMGRDLYASEAYFRAEVDRCALLLEPHLGEDIRDILYPGPDADAELAATRIKQTVMAQPAIFVMSYCQARLLMHWGITPEALVGHSVGELTAACLAGVVSLEDALEILAVRGRLMQDVEPGGMLSVRLPENEACEHLNGELDLAAVNGTALCVLSGPHGALEKLESDLEARRIPAKRLHTSHGFHSWMMDPVIEPFREVISRMELHPPKIPIRSTVTTEWLSDAEACDPEYWASHVRRTVRFTQAITHFREKAEATLLEVGPGQTLSTLSRQAGDKSRKQTILSTSGHATSEESDAAIFQLAAGKLWLAGHTLNWSQYDEDEERRRVPLPGYPFERKRFWIDPVPLTNLPAATAGPAPLTPLAATPAPPTPMTEPGAIQEPAERKPAIITRLKEILSELSGIEPEEMEAEATLLELGFDSLMLTQVGKEVQQAFDVPITMRQLLVSLPTIEKLADHLDTEIPAEAMHPVAAAPTAAPAPVAAPVAAPGNPLPVPRLPANGLSLPPGATNEDLVRQVVAMQMQIMQQQLEMLGAAAPAPSAASPAPSLPKAPAPRSTASNGSRSGTDAPMEFSGPSTAIDRSAGSELSAEQQEHLDALIERYTKRTPASKEWTAKYRQWHADPRTASGFNRLWKEMIYQFVVKKSKGSRLLDIDGNEYIDCLNGFGPGFFGHSPDFVLEAVEKQLHEGYEVGPQTPLAGETARLFCEVTGNERASFVNTGSEAVQAAMRLARTVTGRDKIAVFSKDYHGNFDEVLVRGLSSKGTHRALPIAPGIPKTAVNNMLVLDYGTPESLEILKQQAGELAAIIVEPVQSRRPEFRPHDFIHELRTLTAQSGSLLVFDEVITGFRDGPQGAQAYYGVQADLATYGKVVGGGLPIGVVAGKAEFMDTFDGGMWQYGDDSFPEAGVTFFAGTFVRHPLAIAAANACLHFLKNQGEEFWDTLNARAARLYTTIDEFMVANDAPIRVPGFNSRFFVRVAPDSTFGNLLFFHLREKGVYLLEGFPSYVTAAHTDAEIDYIIDAFKESVFELQAGGFFPRSEAGEALNCRRLTGPEPILSQGSPATSTPFTPAEPIAIAPPAEPSGDLPLTEAQREIWLACNLGHEASCAFNEATSLIFDGALDRAALGKALRQVVNLRDALRARFSGDGESWSIVPEVSINLPFDDLAAHSADEKESAIQLESETQVLTPFDLQQAPLLRAKLLKVDADRHILFLTAHHIVCDGWSFNVLIEDLSDHYNALVEGGTPPTRRPARFADYAVRRSTLERTGGNAVHKRYWLEQYPDLVPVIDLPVDRPFPAMRSFAGGTIARHVDADLVTRLRKTGARHGATLYATMLTAYQILLHQLTRQESLVIGIPAAGQTSEDDENLLGHCVNFLPLHGRVTAEHDFAGLVREVSQTVLDAYEHQDCTYGELLPELKIQRQPGRMPLVEVGFNLERMDYFKPFRNLETQFLDLPKRFVNQLIFLNLVESAEGLSLECHFNADALESATVAGWIDSYIALLTGIVESPEMPIEQLPLARPVSEADELPFRVHPKSDYPRHAAIHQIFAGIAGADPGRVALVTDTGEVSYGDLNTRADGIAGRLRAHGVTRSVPVAVLMNRSVDFVAGILGILKAGGAYVPIDPGYPAGRIAELLADVAAPLVLTHRNLQDRLPDELDTVVLLADEETDNVNGVSHPNGAAHPPEPADDGDPGGNLAYIMYTSGSTGSPKGVCIPHRGVVRLVKGNDYADLSHRQVFLQSSSLSFDASTFEIWAPLLNGGRLVLMPPGTPTLAGIGEHIRKHEVTTLWLTAGLFHLMVDERIEDLKPLKQLLAGGDVLSRHHVNKAFQALPGCLLVNGYGPTENTTFSCCHRIVEDDLDGESIPIGKAIANTEVCILGPGLQPLPPGSEGEIFLGGDGLALGYHRHPELTTQAFVPNPFAEDPGARLYRTGDRGRFRPDGTIEFTGRLDTQIKIRGFRVEPREIEYALHAHEGVHQAVVVARGTTPHEQTLVAYVVSTNAQDGEAQLKEHLRQRLPSYLIPSRVILVDSFAVTENGKIDHDALPDPAGVGGEDATLIRYPSTEAEKTMADLWRTVLNLEDIPANRSFFDLGGHSLQALRLFNKMEKSFGVRLPLATLFECPTLGELSRLVLPKATVEAVPPSLVPMKKSGNGRPFFCIHGGDGGTLIYRDLVAGMSADHPLYALEAPILSGAGEISSSIEETASLYLSHIRTVQPEGPYLLGGYCFGGVVVYEMAQQLRALGEAAELVALFDTDNPAVAPKYLSLAERAAANWKANSEINWARRVGRLSERFGGGLVTHLKIKTEKAAATVVAGAGLEIRGSLQAVMICEAHEKALGEYTPKVYDGDLILFTAEDQGDKVVYPAHLGWEGYVRGKLEIVPIPGAHISIFKLPQVDVMARELDMILADYS